MAKNNLLKVILSFLYKLLELWSIMTSKLRLYYKRFYCFQEHAKMILFLVVCFVIVCYILGNNVVYVVFYTLFIKVLPMIIYI